MKLRLIIVNLILLLFAVPALSQIPSATHVQILKAEDALDLESIKPLLSSKDLKIQQRAILAAGRIGDERAVEYLTPLLAGDSAAIAAFSLGEIESIKAADAILIAIGETGKAQMPGMLRGTERGRLAEAAGKIAAANPKEPKTNDLGKSILFTLEAEYLKDKGRNSETVLLALTAALRARPEGADAAAAKFLSDPNARVRADAANALARIRATNANDALRKMLAGDSDAVARANAARALGAADDKDAADILVTAATKDAYSRVRVSAIRSLGALKVPATADPLISYGNLLLQSYTKAKKPDYLPAEHSEFLEVAVALSQIIPDSFNENAVKLFREFGKLDKGHSPEVYIARLRIAPGRGDNEEPELAHWRQYRTLAQIVGEFSAIEPTTDEGKRLKAEAPKILQPLAKAFAEADPDEEASTILAAPDTLRAYARFKTEDLDQILRSALKNKDVQIRAAAAELLGEQSATKENTDALRSAFARSLLIDKNDNDAQLSMLSAIVKLNKAEAADMLKLALSSPDHLLRRRADELIRRNDLGASFDGISYKVEPLRIYDPKTGTKLGQVLNTDADYRRAAARKNGSVKAVLTTQKGAFTIDLLPEDAPLTVDNFIKLANMKYFDGLEVHRVVPNFVMQDGDPRGDGNGGPGWSIRCEINMVPYERGVVGMALSGKDTGGSQWFVTHSPQPHLDGGYTVFGKVNESDMKVVDNIVRGDRILTVRIVGR